MYINHTPDSCTPLRNKKLLKSSSGLLVQNRSRDKSMKREQALEKKKKPEQKGFIFCLAHFWLTLLLYQAVFLSVVFTLFMWKESTNEFRFLPRLAAMVIWGSNTQTMTMLTWIQEDLRSSCFLKTKPAADEYTPGQMLYQISNQSSHSSLCYYLLLGLDHKHPKYIHKCKGHLTLNWEELTQSAFAFETESYNIP